MSLPTTLLLDTNVISMLMRDPHGHVTEGLNRARALAPDLRVVTAWWSMASCALAWNAEAQPSCKAPTPK